MAQKTPQQIELAKLQARLTRRFHKACADYGLIADGDHILIGLSGGKDSLALVELLGRRAQIYKPRFRVTAVHVRVKERAYATDLSYLEQFCQEAKVPLIIRDTEIGEKPAISLEGRKVTPSLQGRSGEAVNPCFLCAWYRRKALFDVAQQIGCNKIALGHHRDDVAQTLLMNLIFQGAFATIPPILPMDKMPLSLIRPLYLIDEVDLTRYAELREYQKPPKLCPFEHVTSREKAKELLQQIRQLNPEAVDNIYGAMTNIKTDYLPKL